MAEKIEPERAGTGDEQPEQGPSRRERYEADMKVEGSKRAMELGALPRWPLYVSLLWIGIRDLHRFSECIAYAETEFGFRTAGRAAYVTFFVREHPGCLEPNPAKALLKALRRGEVMATGRPNGLERASLIEPLQWDSLDFLDGPPELNAIDCAIRSNWKPIEAVGEFWSNLQFDKASLMATFPPTGASGHNAVTTAESENAIASPRVGRPPKERLKVLQWLSEHPEVDARRNPQFVAKRAGVSVETVKRALGLK